MRLVDSHCHFDDDRFDVDRAAAYSRAREAGVVAQIVPAVAQNSWHKLSIICQNYPGLYPAYGLHPMLVGLHQDSHVTALDQQLTIEQAVAVGECGLDFYIDNPDRERQLQLFEMQLELARKHSLPVIVHARKAVDEVIICLRHYPRLRGVLHSYSGSEQQAQRLIELGFMMSFGGPITYPNANRLRLLVSRLPLESIMLESDAPDQPDAENRGGRNEPALLGRVLNAVAQIRTESAAEIAAQTTANACRLFALGL